MPKPTEDQLYGLYRTWVESGHTHTADLAAALNRRWSEAWTEAEGELESVWHAFHRAWTACVGTPRYDKGPWRECAKQVGDAVGPMGHLGPETVASSETMAEDVAGWLAAGDDEDVDKHNREQRIRRTAYAEGISVFQVTDEAMRLAAARYPLRKRVPKVISDPQGYGEFTVTAGDVLLWRHKDGGSWFEEGPQLSVARVRAIAALLEDPFSWQESTEVEEA